MNRMIKLASTLKVIRKALKESADPKVLASAKKFFKEEIKIYGVSSTAAQKIGKETFKLIKDSPKEDIWELCEALWKSGYNEEACLACTFSDAVATQFVPDDFKVFEHWVKDYVSNWASCDTLCNHTVGTFVEMYPAYIPEIQKWAKSKNRWMRRASAVTFIIPARKGLFLNNIFEIADSLLLDTDDLVQKGYGWMLKAASEAYCEAVFQYVMSKKAVMPRTALRYAIEKMPADKKVMAMKK
jgi:3-methyladenine DNA glycosylase AlkD